MGKIISICVSEKRGTAKKPVKAAVLTADFGIEGDAHAGTPKRQVSMLRYEDISDFNEKGGDVSDGDFGENLIVSGIDSSEITLGKLFKAGNAVLKVTQIGKECHNDCEIKQRVGICIMPRKGVFFEVINGGTISIGDEISSI